MAKAYLLLGSNIGDRSKYLSKAVSSIESTVGIIIYRSGIYETGAWGYSSKNNFLNMALRVDTTLEPEELLTTLKKIEKSLGRKASAGGYSDREIDIDIIFFDDVVLETDELTIPHPLMAERDFVLRPLNEIAPDFVHPVLGKSVQELLGKDESKK